MKVTPTAIPEVLVIEPKVFGDHRGFFLESFNQMGFDEAIGRNHSRSVNDVPRGLPINLASTMIEANVGHQNLHGIKLLNESILVDWLR